MKTLPDPDLDNIRALLIDEKSIGKGHHYLTVVLNADTGETLFLGEGKRKATLDQFLESGSYQASVKEHIPDADIVYDKFHIIANYNEVIDNIRRREWRQAEEDDKPFIKGQRFNLFRNPRSHASEGKQSERTACDERRPVPGLYAERYAQAVVDLYVQSLCQQVS